jgi:ABC-type lipoprotein release transport system permease subunit
MGSLRLLLRSIVHYRRAHAGLVAGTLLASAILTGAMVVGDSVDHTLTTFGAQRIGNATLAITAGERLFSTELSDALRAQVAAPVSALLQLPGMAIHQTPDTGDVTQVNNVQALGVDAEFWGFGDGPALELGRREAALNAPLAARLGVQAGDTVALRIAKPGLLSRDAPLSSREEDASERANFVVKSVVTDAQMGRFGLAPSQVAPYNFYVSLADLQQLSGTEQQGNLMLIGEGTTAPAVEHALAAVWQPTHAGLRVADRGKGRLQLESSRIFLDMPTARAGLALPGAKGALTYLVNRIAHGDRLTPYSFMTASAALTEGLRDDEIVLNAWTAEQLQVAEGGTVTVTYYQVLPSNRFEERTRDFTVRRILSMDDFAPEREMVPEFPGLSNVESCRDWKIGMPMDEELLKDPANEEYWQTYHQTPKALVTLAAGQSMWMNRFGSLTGVRFPPGADAAVAMASLKDHLAPKDVGMEVRRIREDAIAATSQAMDLGGLFLGMSFFLLGAALILTGMLYAFGMQQRAGEAGLLSALGYTRRRIRTLLLVETLIVAVPGALLGAGFGMAYAWALMLGLAHLWQDAVGNIPILFHTQPDSVIIGIVATVVCALLTASWTLRRLLRQDATALISGDFSQETDVHTRKDWVLTAAALCGGCALSLVIYGYVSPPADVAGLFFGSGALALVSGLLLVQQLLSRGRRPQSTRQPSLLSLALLNATRRRGRSLGMVASLASGGFMVLAVSSMQSDPSVHAHERWSGTGGFALYGEATVPILDPSALDAAAPGVKAIGLRKFDGDDASCLNLNRAIRPRVLGVDPAQLAALHAFVDEEDAALWDLLHQDLGEGIIPALVGDSDTAMWTLQKKTGVEGGDSILYTGDDGRVSKLKLVGKLPMRLSVFQGTLLISAEAFTKLWPAHEGFRTFLIDAPADSLPESIDRLQRRFDRDGLEVTTTVARLEMFHAVEGTYLNLFLVLGGIGLLLGASATGVVVLRNLLERRREIALLRALGFTPQAVFRLLGTEYGLLLLLGALVGGVSSVVAMLPSLSAAHGGASPLWRLGVFGLVMACAAACTLAALAAGLRKTRVDDLRAE